MKLKWKITLPLLLLLLALTALTTAINYVMTRSAVEKSVSSILDSNLETLISQINRSTETEMLVIEEISGKNLTLSHIFAEILKVNTENDALDLGDVGFFIYIADLLGVTEINVADRNGTIVGSNIAENYGFNFGSSESTRAYMAILNNPALEIVEEPRESAVSGDMFQYMGTARTDSAGFVQIGIDAKGLKEFRNHLDIVHTASDMRIGEGGRATVISNGAILYSAIQDRIGQNVSNEAWYRQVSSGRGSAWINISGEELYAGYGNVDRLTLLVLYPKVEYNEQLSSVGSVAIASVITAVVISVLIYFSVARTLTPLIPLTAFLTKAGTTGDITLEAEDIEVISRLSTAKDELGQCINAAAKFVERLTEVSIKLETVADGDLTDDIIPLSERDTIGLSLRKMNEKLNMMFNEINSSTQQVSLGARQIADGAQTLAQGSTEQAASIEELSSSITEIAKKTRENADVALRTAQLADTIRNNAEKGSFQMDEMISAVREITEASNNISKVIKVIDDIAFQTNILALNAAVEAARAGQHGKGFAVVAEEVRNLAAKSAEAAKETGVMIQDSMEKAEIGARIAEETASSLTDIVVGINESTQLINGIAASSEDQSTDITHINSGIDQVSIVIQQNSGTAQESAAASQEMSSQSSLLQELIAQFKLKNAVYLSALSHGNNLSAHEIASTKVSRMDGEFGKY